MKYERLILLGLILLALGACVPTTTTPEPTASPTATLAPTSTLVPSPTQITNTPFPVTPIGRWDAITDCISGRCLLFDNADRDVVVGEVDDQTVVTVIDVAQAEDLTITCFIEGQGWLSCSQVEDVCGYCDKVCLSYGEFFACIEDGGQTPKESKDG